MRELEHGLQALKIGLQSQGPAPAGVEDLSERMRVLELESDSHLAQEQQTHAGLRELARRLDNIQQHQAQQMQECNGR